jgi:hypothetical protein
MITKYNKRMDSGKVRARGGWTMIKLIKGLNAP